MKNIMWTPLMSGAMFDNIVTCTYSYSLNFCSSGVGGAILLGGDN